MISSWGKCSSISSLPVSFHTIYSKSVARVIKVLGSCRKRLSRTRAWSRAIRCVTNCVSSRLQLNCYGKARTPRRAYIGPYFSRRILFAVIVNYVIYPEKLRRKIITRYRVKNLISRSCLIQSCVCSIICISYVYFCSMSIWVESATVCPGYSNRAHIII